MSALENADDANHQSEASHQAERSCESPKDPWLLQPLVVQLLSPQGPQQRVLQTVPLQRWNEHGAVSVVSLRSNHNRPLRYRLTWTLVRWQPSSVTSWLRLL